MRQQKIDSYKEKNPNVDPVQLRAVYYLLRVKHGIRNVTVLGVLYKTVFLRMYSFKFHEEFRYYSDMTFLSGFSYKVR